MTWKGPAANDLFDGIGRGGLVLRGSAGIERRAIQAEDHLLLDLLLDALGGWWPSVEALAREVGEREGGS